MSLDICTGLRSTGVVTQGTIETRSDHKNGGSMTSVEVRATHWLRHVSLVRGEVHLLLDDGSVWRVPGESRIERYIHRRYRDLELLGDARVRVAQFVDGVAADMVFAGHGLDMLLGDAGSPHPAPPHADGFSPTA